MQVLLPAEAYCIPLGCRTSKRLYLPAWAGMMLHAGRRQNPVHRRTTLKKKGRQASACDPA